MQESINRPSMLKIGTLLRGIYRIDSYLSSGGFGNTYVATNIEFDERVAIKEFFMKGVTQREDNQTTVSVSNSDNTNSFLEQKEKFKKEARRIRQLKNEHIVAVHDLFEENGTAYYVMDYVDGENLAERLKRTGKPMTEQEVRDVFTQILNALKSVHDAGIWHLDIKPANILIDKKGNVKLIDFGASKQLNAQKGGATTSTAISYTNGYAPREQMEQNYDKFGPWTDIYALGATLYNLLTNMRPPLPTDIDDDMSEDKHLVLPFPKGISDEMKQVILCMMKTNRSQRPQDIKDIIHLFERRDNNLTIDYLNEETIIVEESVNKNENKTKNLQEEKDKKRIGKIKRLSLVSIIVITICGLLICFWKYMKQQNKKYPQIEIISEIDKTCQLVGRVEYDNNGRAEIIPCISKDYSGNYRIPKEVNGYTVIGIGDYAFRDTKITSVEIFNNISFIGEHAFSYSQLSWVNLPKTVKNIGKSAFRYCKSLNSVYFHDASIIGEYAFGDCTNLSNITVYANPGSFVLGNGCFDNISSGATLSLPNTYIIENDSKWKKYFVNIKAQYLFDNDEYLKRFEN